MAAVTTDDDEETLQCSIKEYETQLVQLDTALQVTDGQDREELLKLKEDMRQLIDLSKENLLSLKKKRLLREIECLEGLNNVEDGTSSVQSVKDHHDTNNLTLDASSENDNSDLEDLLTSLEGTCCQAPFGYEWGQQGYHNAMVLTVEPHDNILSIEDIQVRVLFCNPLDDAMKPCPFFMEGNCRYEDAQCRFSHGFLVPFGKLRKFTEPDYSFLQRDTRCLAKYKDGLWYPAVVESVGSDHTVVVKYTRYNDIVTLQLEDIVPQEMLVDSSESDVDTASSDSDDNGSSDPVVVWVSTAPTGQALGQWEQHTRGIGSKLLEKMGYVLGMGLGKNGQGRTEPVEAVIVPQGKSLDKVMELREKAGCRDMRHVEKKLKQKERRRARKLAHGYQKDEKRSVFDFINDKLMHNQQLRKNQPHSKLTYAAAQDCDLKVATAKGLNTQSFKVSEDIRRAEQELRRLNSALSRNQTRDKIVASQLMQKISQQEREIDKLKAYEQAIEGERSSRSSGKKLTVF